MDTFVVSYLVVWLAVAAYVARLGAQQRGLRKTVSALQARLAQLSTREST